MIVLFEHISHLNVFGDNLFLSPVVIDSQNRVTAERARSDQVSIGLIEIIVIVLDKLFFIYKRTCSI